MSVLVKDFLPNINQVFDLNIAVSLAVLDTLESLNIPGLSIKWPNDIMSYAKKVGGILIENSIKSDGSIHSIVGLGLNINQINFESLPKASSLAVICSKEFDKEKVLVLIVENIKGKLQLWNELSDSFWKEYATKLFKKGQAVAFSNEGNQKFMGIIQGVSSIGKLQILLEDDAIAEFNIKEIQMLY